MDLRTWWTELLNLCGEIMTYIENPKTKGSGIVCAIPQTGECPVGCEDCFFQSGRSYLEPLDENLPNLPNRTEAYGRVVRMNDGNDSNVSRSEVQEVSKRYENVFFNTSMVQGLNDYPGPVVLTVNPGDSTDTSFPDLFPVPKNLMFVRFRVNMWNLDLLDSAVAHYTSQRTPVVVTFMAYFTSSVREGFEHYYTYRKRTMNSYWVITPNGWDEVMERYKDNPLVYTCGKDANTFPCKHCGNCLREYYATKVRMAK